MNKGKFHWLWPPQKYLDKKDTNGLEQVEINESPHPTWAGFENLNLTNPLGHYQTRPINDAADGPVGPVPVYSLNPTQLPFFFKNDDQYLCCGSSVASNAMNFCDGGSLQSTAHPQPSERLLQSPGLSSHLSCPQILHKTQLLLRYINKNSWIPILLLQNKKTHFPFITQRSKKQHPDRFLVEFPFWYRKFPCFEDFLHLGEER